MFIGFDLDNDNLKSAREIIEKEVGELAKQREITIHYIHANFRDIKDELQKLNIDNVTAVCYDL